MSSLSGPMPNTTKSMPNRSDIVRLPPRSDADYRAALAEAESLMDAASDTPAGDRLDLLATLIEAWEDVHSPIPPPDPIAAILFMMEQKGLTRRDLEGAKIGRAHV